MDRNNSTEVHSEPAMTTWQEMAFLEYKDVAPSLKEFLGEISLVK